MFPVRAAAMLVCLSIPLSVRAEDPATVRDLKSPVTLTRAELQQLLPGAKLSRVSAKGSNQTWTNDSDGTMVVYSDNRMYSSVRSATTSKWHISDDGRYCVLIPFKTAGTEEWCRFVLKTGDGYYMAKSVDLGSEKVHRFEISK